MKNSILFFYINHRSKLCLASLVMALLVVVITLISVFSTWSMHQSDLVELELMYATLPDFSKYHKHVKTHEGESYVKAMEHHWSNKFYGGSLLFDVLSQDLQPIPNNLNETFSLISREQKHFSKFLIFENILLSQTETKARFADFWILINTAGFSTMDQELIQSNAVNLEQTGPIHTKRIITMSWMSKMQRILSGYGRMVVFETHN